MLESASEIADFGCYSGVVEDYGNTLAAEVIATDIKSGYMNPIYFL